MPVEYGALLPANTLYYRTGAVVQVRMYNSLGSVDRARTCYEWTLCSTVSGIVFIVLTILALSVSLLVLRFAAGIIG